MGWRDGYGWSFRLDIVSERGGYVYVPNAVEVEVEVKRESLIYWICTRTLAWGPFFHTMVD